MFKEPTNASHLSLTGDSPDGASGSTSNPQSGTRSSRSQDGTAPGLVFEPVNDPQRSLDARIVTRIRDLIETGQLRPGDRLPPERELAVQLKVSRTVLREALHTLAAFGLVELQHGRGIFVTAGSAHATAHRLSLAMTSGDTVARFHDLFEIRRILEGAAAEWAAERATSEQIAQLRAMLVEGAAIYETEPVNVALAGALDARFHATLAASTHNRTLMLLMATLVDELGVSRGRTLAIPGRARRSFHQHEAVVAAIAAHNGAIARAAMLEHLNDVEQSILQAEGANGQDRD